MAKLYFYYGTMFSAKSAKLLIMIHNFRERGRSPLVLTSSLDDRFGSTGEIHSRIPGLSCKAHPVSSGNGTETDIVSLFSEGRYDVVMADEVQFFSPSQVDQLAQIVDKYDVNVFAFGLRTSFKHELFPSTARLMAAADTIREIKTMCECGRKATVNALLDDTGAVLTEGADIQIGSSEYAALCRRCWKKRTAGYGAV
ncbi:MAG: thymidine kinase [Spirochaetota bacterium]